MNSSRYIISRLFLAFGFGNKNKRLTEAASETHLLRQAEEILGEDVWQKVEDIEELSVEYWGVRQMKMYIEELQTTIADADKQMSVSHAEHDVILKQTNEGCHELDKERKAYKQESEKLMSQRERVIASAKKVKRRFEAANIKIQVLNQEKSATSEVLAEEKDKIEGCKVELQELKKQSDQLSEENSAVLKKMNKIEAALSKDRERLRREASSAYQSIGKVNQDISKLSLDVGSVESEMLVHYCAIGRYVSSHVGIDERCTQIAHEHSSLIAQMQSLRSSIALNHKLAALTAA